jgi:hypothetical protein
MWWIGDTDLAVWDRNLTQCRRIRSRTCGRWLTVFNGRIVQRAGRFAQQ